MGYDLSTILRPDSKFRVTTYMLQRWCDRSFSYRQRPRPDNGILFVTQGKIDFVFAQTHLIAQSGDMVFLPKGVHYEAVIHPEYGETRDYLVNFEADICVPEPAPCRILHTTDPVYIGLFDTMIDWKLRGNVGEFRILSQFYALLDKIMNDHNQGWDRAKNAMLKKARQMLVDRVDLPVSKIAELCGVSQSGLRSGFVQVYGISPMQYRVEMKLQKAKFLLEATDKSVAQIADELGFYDEAYFCKVFRKRVGCSPRKYLHDRYI